MTWVARMDRDYFYAGLILFSGLAYPIVKDVAFDYSLIPFGFCLGVFSCYLFENWNVTWRSDNRNKK